MSELSDAALDALNFVGKAQELQDLVRDRLPDGTDFGVVILVPNPDGEPHVVMVCTDRQVVAPAVGRWVVEILGDDGGGAG